MPFLHYRAAHDEKYNICRILNHFCHVRPLFIAFEVGLLSYRISLDPHSVSNEPEQIRTRCSICLTHRGATSTSTSAMRSRGYSLCIHWHLLIGDILEATNGLRAMWFGDTYAYSDDSFNISD